MTAIHTLSSIVLPAQIKLERDLPRRANYDEGESTTWTHYDRRTLIYDVIYFPGTQVVRIYLPRLLNLGSLVSDDACIIDGRSVSPIRHRIYRRFETLDFSVGSSRPRTFSVSVRADHVLHAPINIASPESFENRSVIYTLMKDEKLEWIQDWLHFHNRVQGADAVLIANNGSTNYSSEQLLRAMQAIPGYLTTAVLSVPLPWGPRGHVRGADDGKYLQTTMLNLTRDRFFLSARGVLNLDVDELLLRRGSGSGSVFDSVQRWGLTTFPGEWRYPVAGVSTVRHEHHRYRDPKDKPCATKYCFRPSSMLGRMCLSVHGLERLSRKLFSGRRDFMFLHCRNISTSWKYDRLQAANSTMTLDRQTSTLMDTVFADPLPETT